MFDLYAHVNSGLQETLKAKFEDRELKRRVGVELMTWLRTRAKTRPVADLEQRFDKMDAAVSKMVENMKFDFAGGKVVIKTAGSDEDTLKAFRLGTMWFEPNPDLVETVLTGLFAE